LFIVQKNIKGGNAPNQIAWLYYSTVELRLSELIKTRGGSDK